MELTLLKTLPIFRLTINGDIDDFKLPPLFSKPEVIIGQVQPFEISHQFKFANKQGWQPFFPLLHHEVISVSKSNANYPGTSIVFKAEGYRGSLYLEKSLYAKCGRSLRG